MCETPFELSGLARGPARPEMVTGVCIVIYIYIYICMYIYMFMYCHIYTCAHTHIYR